MRHPAVEGFGIVKNSRFFSCVVGFLCLLSACGNTRHDHSGRPTEESIRNEFHHLPFAFDDELLLIDRPHILFAEATLAEPVSPDAFRKKAEDSGWASVPEREKFSDHSRKFQKGRLCMRLVTLNEARQVSIVWASRMESEDYCAPAIQKKGESRRKHR